MAFWILFSFLTICSTKICYSQYKKHKYDSPFSEIDIDPIARHIYNTTLIAEDRYWNFK